jgi:hypothetical protein
MQLKMLYVAFVFNGRQLGSEFLNVLNEFSKKTPCGLRNKISASYKFSLISNNLEISLRDGCDRESKKVKLSL